MDEFLWKDKKMLHNGKGIFLLISKAHQDCGCMILPNGIGRGNRRKKTQKHLIGKQELVN